MKTMDLLGTQRIMGVTASYVISKLLNNIVVRALVVEIALL